MSETFSNSTTWECPHCGEKNTIYEDDWVSQDGEPGIVVGHAQCPQCECYSKLEFEKSITLSARSLSKEDIPKIIEEEGIKPDNAQALANLEGSIDQEDP
jgi:rubredoxin